MLNDDCSRSTTLHAGDFKLYGGVYSSVQLWRLWVFQYFYVRLPSPKRCSILHSSGKRIVVYCI